MMPRCHIAGACAAGLLLALLGAAGAGAADAPLRARLAWQLALERVGLSPGIIDGRIGPKTRLATRELQRMHGLPQTGELDPKTAAALGVNPKSAVAAYTVVAADLAQVGPVPKGWLARSKVSRLPYPSLGQALAERFHCSRALLAQLNPSKSIAGLKAGETIQVPAVADHTEIVQGQHIDINLSQKVIRVVSADRKLVGLFHCSIAAARARLPSGRAHVAVIVDNPSYTFDPKMWPEVKGISRTLTIPPGPRNPVGVCWIGLSLPGYGIHGTPAPELIGKTGSHGCFRLTNWDARRLARMIRVGTPVSFSTAQK